MGFNVVEDSFLRGEEHDLFGSFLRFLDFVEDDVTIFYLLPWVNRFFDNDQLGYPQNMIPCKNTGFHDNLLFQDAWNP